MRTLEGIQYVIIICLLRNVLCEVIVRQVNKKAGSLCYLRDRTKGVCRERCPGQRRDEYIESVCNPGENKVLYCCVDSRERQQYPTIQEVCLNRRLTEEFEQKGRDIADKLNDDLRNLQRKYSERVTAAIDWCEETAQSKSEDERDYFLKHCLTIPQRPDISMSVQHIGRRFKNAHVAGIGFVNANETITWLCSGTFIHPKYILTAAFCILTDYGRPNIVRVGTSNLNGEMGTDFRISETIIHSDHGVNGGLYHDLAILKVEANSNQKKSEEVVPACIWTNGDPRQEVTVMGYWGMSVSSNNSGYFFHGNVSFTMPDECNRQESFVSFLPSGIIEGQVCAREYETDYNACAGEVGGALHFTEEGWLKIPYIVGVGSIGAPCDSGEPSVYTLLSPYLDWIESVISES